MFPTVLVIAQVKFVVQVIKSVVLVCCDLFRNLPEFLDKWYSILLGELQFYIQGNKILKLRLKNQEQNAMSTPMF